MKKLLYFSHGLSANGIETFLCNVLKYIDKSKFDVTVAIAIDEGVGQLREEEVLGFGVKVVRVGDMDGIKKKLQYILNVKKLLKNGDYDIVHSNMDLLNGITLAAARKAGVKKRICHAHTSKTQYNPDGALAKLKKYLQKAYSESMKSEILKSSTDLLACSSVAGEYFYGERDYKIIYNGVDFKSFEMPTGFDKDGYSAELGFDGDEKHRIVSVGRISNVKNPRFALEVIAELKKLRSDFKYAWVGEGEDEEAIKKYASELGVDDIVIFTGLRTDVPRVLNCCDCFLMTSFFEGLPFSLVEAQAAGLKCVVSDVVTKAADIGAVKYLSLDESAEAWARFIDRELDAPKPEIDSEKAKLFSIENTVKSLEEIYES